MMEEVNGHPIPVYDGQGKILFTVPFVDNLTLTRVPDYVNMNGYMGIARVHSGELVIMYYDKKYSETSYGEVITEEEAYKACLNRGKLDVAKELGLRIKLPTREVI